MLIKVSKVLLLLVLALSYAGQGEAQSQVYFQYEQSGTLDVKRWTAGDKILFRQKRFGKEWISDRIVRLLPEDNAILFQDQIVHLDEISHIQYRRPVPDIFGRTLTYFGAAWLLYGGALHGLTELNVLESGFQFGRDTAIIGVTSIASGYLMQKLWSKATKKMNANKRIRIVDLRF